MRGRFLRIRAVLARIWRNLASRPVPAKHCSGPTSNNTVKLASGRTEGGCNGLGPAEMKQAAIAFLHEWLFPLEIGKIRALIKQHGPGEWIWHLHDKDIVELYPKEKKYAVMLSPQFGFGMQVRNALRRAGFGEQKLGVQSLEDVYVALLEAAVEERTEPNEEHHVMDEGLPPEES